MKKLILLLAFINLCNYAISQVNVSGNVSDDRGEALIGVNIVEDGTSNGTVTDFDGNYSLSVSNTNAELTFSYTGYTTSTVNINGQSVLNVSLSEGINLGAVQVVGTRSYKRSATETPVAVDIIDIQEVATKNGNIELNRILQYLAPSFNATKQSGSDGAEPVSYTHLTLPTTPYV